jgi:hypothetical protein
MTDTTQSKYAPIPGKIPGQVVNLGGHDLVLAPLTIEQIEKLGPQIDTLGVGDKTLSELVELAAPIILLSVNRNYPDMTLAELRGLLDVGNVRQAAEAAVRFGFGVPASAEAPIQ